MRDDASQETLLSLDGEICPMRGNKHAQSCEGWNYFP